ncbi:TPR repeat protein [Legionella gratiana]|uniref:TPR repeat protein n=1 Tax=Legionella gratiana TaxID=45066 RepID=A0A378J8S5_9GAMM|nr:tetratricopeptide repeat protein [Legionella gratiana]KTD14765.1 TPR repeat protein [Legionella gratiana]STX44234.1 TPR repeat protein [Legionella gratiana]
MKQDQKTLKENPGYYYYRLGLCEFRFIHNQSQFNEVVDTLTKSLKYGYTPSYFALGLLYDNKFKSGSLWLHSKGKISDLLKSIENYKKAAENQSVLAENNLGEVYLHSANLTEKYRSNNDSNDIPGVSKLLPNLDSALYWLDRAAKHGNPAAQGTLADLYYRGIGIPQDFVMAYVWQNLSVTSQFRYNKNMQDNATGRKLVNSQRLLAKKQYNNLTEMQKDSSQALLKEYSKLYFKASSELDEECQSAQTYIAGTLALRYIKVINKLLEK